MSTSKLQSLRDCPVVLKDHILSCPGLVGPQSSSGLAPTPMESRVFRSIIGRHVRWPISGKVPLMANVQGWEDSKALTTLSPKFIHQGAIPKILATLEAIPIPLRGLHNQSLSVPIPQHHARRHMLCSRSTQNASLLRMLQTTIASKTSHIQSIYGRGP